MSEHPQSRWPNPWRVHRHVMRSLGSPLTETRGGGETVSVRKREDTGELWLQRTVNRTDGAGAVHPDHSLSPIEGPVPCLWTPGEFGWMVADGRLFIGGKLPPNAAACEGVLDDGTPMPASADGETWCATIPLNRTADLRFLAKDGTAALECKVVPNCLIAPRPSLLRRVIDLFRPLPKGGRTYSGTSHWPLTTSH